MASWVVVTLVDNLILVLKVFEAAFVFRSEHFK